MEGTKEGVIISKRVQGSTVKYLLKKGDFTSWMQLDELIEDMALVIAYERKKKAEREGHPVQAEGAQEKLASQPFEAGSVRTVTFMRKEGEELMFRVSLRGGHRVVATGAQMRKWCPEVLIDFYEQHLEVGFDV